jgi:hypothetical protein
MVGQTVSQNVLGPSCGGPDHARSPPSACERKRPDSAGAVPGVVGSAWLLAGPAGSAASESGATACAAATDVAVLGAALIAGVPFGRAGMSWLAGCVAGVCPLTLDWPNRNRLPATSKRAHHWRPCAAFKGSPPSLEYVNSRRREESFQRHSSLRSSRHILKPSFVYCGLPRRVN